MGLALRLLAVPVAACCGVTRAQTPPLPARPTAPAPPAATRHPPDARDNCTPQPACRIFTEDFKYGNGANGIEAGFGLDGRATAGTTGSNTLIYQSPIR